LADRLLAPLPETPPQETASNPAAMTHTVASTPRNPRVCLLGSAMSVPASQPRPVYSGFRESLLKKRVTGEDARDQPCKHGYG